MSNKVMSRIIQVSTVHYPESDGRPMGETDLHRQAMVWHIELLKHHFAGQQVYVSGDLLVYYEQGNPKKFVVPDTFVVKGLSPRPRRIYKIWVEGRSLDAVIETTSRKTKKKDTEFKPALYARLGIKEYFLFDPTEDYLDPPLQGHRLVGDEYQLIVPEADGSLVSHELGLRLRFEAGELVFYRLDTGERLQVAEERAAAAEEHAAAAEQQVAAVKKRAAAAEQQVAAVEERAAAAEEQAAAAEARAAAAEAEAARLREELAHRREER